MEQVRLNAREASAIAAELGEITNALDALDGLEARASTHPVRRALNRIRAPLWDRITNLLTKPQEPTSMQPVAPHSLPVLNVAGYTGTEFDHALDRPGTGPDVGKVYEVIRALPECLAAQVVLELTQRLSRDRQAEIAALLASA